jgi:hypothetical protein
MALVYTFILVFVPAGMPKGAPILRQRLAAQSLAPESSSNGAHTNGKEPDNS